MLNLVQAANRLDKLGWGTGVKKDEEKLRKAIEDFQRGWNLGQHVPASGGLLLVDGKVGAKTSAAIEFSQERRLAGLPTASNNFSFTEFRCKGTPLHARCVRVRGHRELVHGLELMRRQQGPMPLASVYRCPQHNANVGGASSSQHVYGAAADVQPKLTLLDVRRLRKFSGIGVQFRKGVAMDRMLVRHVDVRHLSGNNTTGGTPDRPTVWVYG